MGAAGSGGGGGGAGGGGGLAGGQCHGPGAELCGGAKAGGLGPVEGWWSRTPGLGRGIRGM